MTKTGIVRWLLSAVVFAGIAGCGGGDRGRVAFRLSLTGLNPLPAQQGWYEGFAIGKDGVIRSTGKFNLDPSTSPPSVFTPRGDVLGTTASVTFGPANTYLGEAFPFIWDATGFFVTIEPEGDDDPAPSGNTVLGGPIASDETADLTTAGLLGSGGPGLGDFSGAAGTAVLTTPTDGPGNDARGLWFTTDATGNVPGLSLPVLSGSNTYEAFVTADGATFTSLGRFRDPADFDDDFMSHQGRAAGSVGFRAPGQDAVQGFATSRPSAFDLADGGRRIEITVEPVRDNSIDVFPLVVLSGPVPTTAVTAQKVVAQDNPLTSGFTMLPSYQLALSAGSVAFSSVGAGLRPLGAARDGRYELFALVGGTPSSCGAFVVDPMTFEVKSPAGATTYGTNAAFALTSASTGLGGSFPDVLAATEFFVSIEADGDATPADSGVVLLAGAASGGAASLTTAGLTATGGRGVANFAAVAGTFIIDTPTDDVSNATSNDQFGVWFRRLATSTASLTLPNLPPAWTYEAWVVEVGTGIRASVGRFRSVAGVDDDAATWPGRGPDSIGYAFPGQDFLTAVPPLGAGPTDFTGGFTVLVTVEPTPDQSLLPSQFRVLEAAVPGVPSTFALTNVFSGPTGRLEI